MGFVDESEIRRLLNRIRELEAARANDADVALATERRLHRRITELEAERDDWRDRWERTRRLVDELTDQRDDLAAALTDSCDRLRTEYTDHIDELKATLAKVRSALNASHPDMWPNVHQVRNEAAIRILDEGGE